MVEIAKIPSSEFDSIGGKDIDHVAWYTVDRGPALDKEQMDLVTSDGSIYRWARFDASEPWNWQHRVTPEGKRDGSRYTLPGKVEALVERTDGTLYK